MTTTVIDGWIPLPSGVLVSEKRMQKHTRNFSSLDEYGVVTSEPSVFDLADARELNSHSYSRMPFQGWEQFGIPIEPDEPPVDKFVKMCILARLSAEKRAKHFRTIGEAEDRWCSDEGSYVPTHSEYNDMILDTTEAKLRGDEPLAFQYKRLGMPDLVREVVEFHGKVKAGPNAGKYEATLLRYNDKGILEPVDDIALPCQGRIRVIDKHGYPTETSKEWEIIENLGRPELYETEIEDGISDSKNIHLQGHLFLDGEHHPEPERGEQRFVMHSPSTGGSGMFCTYITRERSYAGVGVSALRLKNPRTE
jgi:hypothetical protein